MLMSLVVNRILAVLIVFSVFLTGVAHSYPRPSGKSKTASEISAAGKRETYNDCDREVLENNPLTGKCRSAFPPLDSGDGLGSQDFFISQDRRFLTSYLLTYPGRPRIKSNTGTAVIRGETFVISALFFARDEATLTEVLQNTELQAKIMGQWVDKRTLGDADHGAISNLRRYYVPKCGLSAVSKFKRSLDLYEKFSLLAYTLMTNSGGLRVPERGGPTGPIELTSLGSTVRNGTTVLPGREIREVLPELAREEPRGLMPLPGGAPPAPMPWSRGGDFLSPGGLTASDAQAMADAALEDASQILDPGGMVTGTVEFCTPKTLPYYWTAVHFLHTPQNGEMMLRFHVDSDLTGVKNINIVEEPFVVYSAAAAKLDVPDNDGNRDFSLSIYAAGDAILPDRARVYYDKNTPAISDILAVPHSTSAVLNNDAVEVTINGRIVKKVTASGKFPYRKHFWDAIDEEFKTKTVSRDGDIEPISMKGKVAYQVTIGGFTSEIADFNMPPPLTFALMGDSFSSGEGAPRPPLATAWLDRDCHRSINSGLFRGVNKFIKEANKPVDFVFKACSGARVQHITNNAQCGKWDGNTCTALKQTKSQANLAKDWMDSQGYDHITAAIFSIGGNNVGFANVIERAITSPGDGTSQETRDMVDDGFEDLNSTNVDSVKSYRSINRVLSNKLGVRNIIILGYPDMPHDTDGEICNSDCPHPDGFNTIVQDELRYGNTIFTRLTDAIKDTRNMGWRYVDIFAATRNHGICVCDNIFYTTFEMSRSASIKARCKLGVGSLPGGESCSFHPNERGYGKYVTPIVDELKALYNR